MLKSNSSEFCYGFRTALHNGLSRNGFTYPDKGKIKCPDWKSINVCGNGLHFLKDFEGEWTLTNAGQVGYRYQLVKVPMMNRGSRNAIDLGSKWKCNYMEVLFSGWSLKDLSNWFQINDPKCKAHKILMNKIESQSKPSVKSTLFSPVVLNGYETGHNINVVNYPLIIKGICINNSYSYDKTDLFFLDNVYNVCDEGGVKFKIKELQKNFNLIQRK